MILRVGVMKKQSKSQIVDPNKRKHLKLAASALCASQLPSVFASSLSSPSSATKTIPSSGQPIPIIGMGTWQTFNVGNNQALRKQRLEVLRAFFKHGGGMIDSSPMYGSSEAVIGYCLEQLGFPASNFSATKVWSSSQGDGVDQINDSHRLWGLNRFDLFQVHNLVGWEKHLPYLQQMKAEGKLKYVGITTSHGRRHRDLETLMESEVFDFVQLTYNIVDREVENSLLPLAKERGIAVIVNRPFRGGALFNGVQRAQLPGWAGEIGCDNWAQFFLKFTVSHQAVTCAIPATTQVSHMEENMAARLGPMPDSKTRQKMIAYMQSL